VSSINTVFQPMNASVPIVSGTPLQALGGQGEFRILNTTAANAVTTIQWGRSAAGTPVPTVAGMNIMSLGPNESIYLCLPMDSFFNVKAGGTIEVTPGAGGAGG
jgi:hypothetical protein